MAHAEAPEFFEQRFYFAEKPRANDIRRPYERDRARLIHSAAFRRLQGKTQVMGTGEGDFHRTRLTHSIECGQIGTGLLDQLLREGKVPPDLKEWFPPREVVEAACFAHDIGHPPFGHGGESALQGEMWSSGGFEGNAHTLRVLVRLEKYSIQGWGINPTRRFILAVLKYPVRYSTFASEKFKTKPPKCYFDEESEIVEWSIQGFAVGDRERLTRLDEDGKPAHRTFDCSVMELADDIAYGIHDIEDIVARRLADQHRIGTALTEAFDAVGGRLEVNSGILNAEAISTQLFSGSFARKQIISRLVSAFCTAVEITERSEFAHPLLRFRAALPSKHQVLLKKLRNMSFGLVIRRAPVQQLETRGQRIVQALFSALREKPEELIPSASWSDGQLDATQERRVCDYIAGMTDSYAERVYRRLFVPGHGSSSDEL